MQKSYRKRIKTGKRKSADTPQAHGGSLRGTEINPTLQDEGKKPRIERAGRPLDWDSGLHALKMESHYKRVEYSKRKKWLSNWTLTPLYNLSTLVEEVSNRRMTLSRWPMKQVGITLFQPEQSGQVESPSLC